MFLCSFAITSPRSFVAFVVVVVVLFLYCKNMLEIIKAKRKSFYNCLAIFWLYFLLIHNPHISSLSPLLQSPYRARFSHLPLSKYVRFTWMICNCVWGLVYPIIFIMHFSPLHVTHLCSFSFHWVRLRIYCASGCHFNSIRDKRNVYNVIVCYNWNMNKLSRQQQKKPAETKARTSPLKTIRQSCSERASFQNK